MNRVLIPHTVHELSEIVAGEEHIHLVAGGTLAVPSRQRERFGPAVWLRGIPELSRVWQTGCGAGVSLAVLASDDNVPSCLSAAARAVGSPLVRNLASIGGNVAAGLPGCMGVALLALQATAWTLQAAGDVRAVPVREVIGSASAPILGFTWDADVQSSFQKVRVGTAGAALGSVAVGEFINSDRPGCRHIAVGGSGLPTEVTSHELEVGYGTDEYRNHLLRVLLNRALERLK